MDQLVGLSDDLGRLDAYVEAITRKVAVYLGEVLEDQRDKLQENLLANNSEYSVLGWWHKVNHQTGWWAKMGFDSLFDWLVEYFFPYLLFLTQQISEILYMFVGRLFYFVRGVMEIIEFISKFKALG